MTRTNHLTHIGIMTAGSLAPPRRRMRDQRRRRQVRRQGAGDNSGRTSPQRRQRRHHHNSTSPAGWVHPVVAALLLLLAAAAAAVRAFAPVSVGGGAAYYRRLPRRPGGNCCSFQGRRGRTPSSSSPPVGGDGEEERGPTAAAAAAALVNEGDDATAGKGAEPPSAATDNDDHLESDPRYAASAWFQILRSLPRSSVLKQTRGPVLASVAWSLVCSWLMRLRIPGGFWLLPRWSGALPALPHGLTVSVVSLLLVFRTNSAYQKFQEGRVIWERVLSATRNLTRLIQLYPDEFEVERRQRLLQLLSAFPYFLRLHVMRVQDGPQGAADAPDGMPWSLLPSNAVQLCAQSENRPLWICDRMGQEIYGVRYTDNYTNREREKFLKQVAALSESVGECERIQSTYVPLKYARHSLRVLTLWLFTLPMSLLSGGYDWWEAAFCQGVAAWMLYGIYQIGFRIEDPFQGSLRMSALCDGVYRSARMDHWQRTSAFDVELDGPDEEWRELPLYRERGGPTTSAATTATTTTQQE